MTRTTPLPKIPRGGPSSASIPRQMRPAGVGAQASAGLSPKNTQTAYQKLLGKEMVATRRNNGKTLNSAIDMVVAGKSMVSAASKRPKSNDWRQAADNVVSSGHPLKW